MSFFSQNERSITRSATRSINRSIIKRTRAKSCFHQLYCLAIVSNNCCSNDHFARSSSNNSSRISYLSSSMDSKAIQCRGNSVYIDQVHVYLWKYLRCFGRKFILSQDWRSMLCFSHHVLHIYVVERIFCCNCNRLVSDERKKNISFPGILLNHAYFFTFSGDATLFLIATGKHCMAFQSVFVSI